MITWVNSSLIQWQKLIFQWLSVILLLFIFTSTDRTTTSIYTCSVACIHLYSCHSALLLLLLLPLATCRLFLSLHCHITTGSDSDSDTQVHYITTQHTCNDARKLRRTTKPWLVQRKMSWQWESTCSNDMDVHAWIHVVLRVCWYWRWCWLKLDLYRYEGWICFASFSPRLATEVVEIRRSHKSGPITVYHSSCSAMRRPTVLLILCVKCQCQSRKKISDDLTCTSGLQSKDPVSLRIESARARAVPVPCLAWMMLSPVTVTCMTCNCSRVIVIESSLNSLTLHWLQWG